MEKILLISNYVYHYRLNNYNYFASRFKEIGLDFQVLGTAAQEVKFDIEYKLDVLEPGFNRYRKYIKREKPDVVIMFMHLKDKIIFPLTYYCRFKRIPVIYWNFGINVLNPTSRKKNFLYYHLHDVSNAIILYSPNELQYIHKRNRKKVFIAYNTLNFTPIDKNKMPDDNHLKNKYGITEDRIVLCLGRITRSKKVHVLFDCFRNSKDVAIAFAGEGMPPEYINVCNEVPNYYYLGEVGYERMELARIFNSCDIFCIPGNIGLALNEAFFWGKPAITLNGRNSPEIYYFKDGVNGYLADDAKDLENKISLLLNDKKLYNEFSANALKTYEEEMHIENMFQGFKDAVDYVVDKK